MPESDQVTQADGAAGMLAGQSLGPASPAVLIETDLTLHVAVVPLHGNLSQYICWV